MPESLPTQRRAYRTDLPERWALVVTEPGGRAKPTPAPGPANAAAE